MLAWAAAPALDDPAGVIQCVKGAPKVEALVVERHSLLVTDDGSPGIR